MRLLLSLVLSGTAAGSIALTASATAYVVTPPPCNPYQCVDGAAPARCDPDGTPIHYFAAPCMTHGGEVGEPVGTSFSDVSPGDLYAEAIAYVKREGIVSGYPDGSFRPGQTINRAELVKIMVEAFLEEGDTDCGLTWDTDTNHPMWDVTKRDWFVNYVCRAYMEGIITGYSDGSFKPAANVNFVEAAKIIVNGVGMKTSADATWYKPYVGVLEMERAIPMTITRFDQQITRGEMAEMIYRLKVGITNKSSRTYEELVGSTGGSAAFSLPQYGFTLGAVTADNCTWEDRGPNDIQQQLDAGEMISGTQPAARKVVSFHCPTFSIPDFTLNVYEHIDFDQEIKEFRGTCGTQFAEKNEINRYITPDGPGPTYIETIQTITAGEKQQADYCFDAGNSTMITLRWEHQMFGALFADMEMIADTVIIQK